MNNFPMAVLSTLCCLLFGAIASGFAAFYELSANKFWLASAISISCLPIGIALGYLAFQETYSDSHNEWMN